MLVRSMTAAVVAAAAVTALVGCSSGRSAPAAPAETAAPSSTSPAAARPVRVPLRPARATSPSPTTVTPVAAALPNHCAGNRAGQKIIVSIRAQHMWLCAHHRLVRDNAVTTGMVGPGTHTPTGNYRIEGRNRDTTLTLNTGQTFAVRYWIPFDAPLFGFHDSSWQHFPYGSPRYRTDGSHGCIHMPLAAIAFLYRWVERPTAVHIA